MIVVGAWLSRLKARFPGYLKGNEYFIKVCPYCGNDRRNCQVNVQDYILHSWCCNVGGTVKGLFYDFNLSVDGLPDAIVSQSETLPAEEEPVVLPAECMELLAEKSMYSHWAQLYLEGRGFTQDDVQKYGIQYAEVGDYEGRVIVPLFEGGDLVYFVARAFRNGMRAYKNPDVRKRNIFPVFYGETDRMTLVVVENVFAAIRANQAGYSSVPLIGKAISPRQIEKARKKNFERYVVMLDPDARLPGMKIADTLKVEGLNAVCAVADKDPDEYAIVELRQAIEAASAPNLADKMKEMLRR